MSSAARDAAQVERFARDVSDVPDLDAAITSCRACPRLVQWREAVAKDKRAAYRDEEYWGRPVPGFGDPAAQLLVVGLAPGAHGANRTGRVFTGDRSGDWLYAIDVPRRPGKPALGHRRRRRAPAVRCPCHGGGAMRAAGATSRRPQERTTCAPWLDRELELLPSVTVLVALGGFAWQAAWAALVRAGRPVPRPRPVFGHGVEVRLAGLTVLGCYHPSQQNTFTGKLTEQMLDDVLSRAAALAAGA